jgi:hypothetical protein
MELREQAPRDRRAALDLTPEQFRRLGHALVDQIASSLASLPQRPVAPAASAVELRAVLPGGGLPERGSSPDRLLAETAQLLFDRSLLNGHPRFWGYITSSAAPIGALADLLAAAVNPNVGAWVLAPLATEIEAQTVAWIAELLGYPSSCGGLLVSGGNMANLVGLLAARNARLPWDVRAGGLRAGDGRAVRIYASTETHTWLQKAVDLAGLGTDSICWIPTDGELRMDTRALRDRLRADEAAGALPLAVVGTAGRSAPAPSTRWRSWRGSAASTGSGSTSTPPTGASPPPFPARPPTCGHLRRPTRWPWTRTSGCTPRWRRAARSSATAPC